MPAKWPPPVRRFGASLQCRAQVTPHKVSPRKMRAILVISRWQSWLRSCIALLRMKQLVAYPTGGRHTQSSIFQTHKRWPHLLLTTNFCCVILLAASCAPLHSAQTSSSSMAVSRTGTVGCLQQPPGTQQLGKCLSVNDSPAGLRKQRVLAESRGQSSRGGGERDAETSDPEGKEANREEVAEERHVYRRR